LALLPAAQEVVFGLAAVVVAADFLSTARQRWLVVKAAAEVLI